MMKRLSPLFFVTCLLVLVQVVSAQTDEWEFVVYEQIISNLRW